MWPARGRARGQVCQEGTNIRIACAFLIALLLVSGCGSGKDKSASKKKDKENSAQKEPVEPQTVNSGAGNAIGYTVEGPRQPIWKAAWNSVRITMTEDGDTLTDMTKASGSFMEDGKEASTFQSDRGAAEKKSGNLDVSGNVVVVSLTHDATIRCDKVHYASKGKQVVQATGNVSVEGKWGTLSGLQEVWATPDLKVFGTPDLFQKR